MKTNKRNEIFNKIFSIISPFIGFTEIPVKNPPFRFRANLMNIKALGKSLFLDNYWLGKCAASNAIKLVELTG